MTPGPGPRDDVHSSALQLQERVTQDVAHDIAKAAGTDDVAVQGLRVWSVLEEPRGCGT
ncbi:hypothetical protein [Kitasatospora sp. NPDC090091]|uniref:hypothetical protein n=1 Tax=Kitasatospora sp. NPDC090091 TaxID=3364081 RepID=UPI003813DF7E